LDDGTRQGLREPQPRVHHNRGIRGKRVRQVRARRITPALWLPARREILAGVRGRSGREAWQRARDTARIPSPVEGAAVRDIQSRAQLGVVRTASGGHCESEAFLDAADTRCREEMTGAQGKRKRAVTDNRSLSFAVLLSMCGCASARHSTELSKAAP